MKVSKNLAVAFGFAFVAMTGSAMAADLAGDAFTDCTCVADSVAGQPIANLVGPKGKVLYSGANGYTPAKGDVTLSDGSVVAVGTAASAGISSGSCNLAVDGNSMVSVSQPAGATGKVCIKVSALTPAGFAALGGGAPALGGLGGIGGLAAAAGLAGAVTLIVLANDDDEPASAQ